MGSYEKFRGEWANANSVKTSLIVNIYLKTLNCTYGVQKNNFFQYQYLQHALSCKYCSAQFSVNSCN